MSGAIFVGVSAFLHVALGRWTPSPWLMPDLTVTSMALAILLLPRRPLSPAVAGGVLVMLMSHHHSLAVGAAYAAVGGLIKLCAGRWDLTSPAFQRLTVIAAQLCLLVVAFLLSVPLTWEVGLLAAGHLLITAMGVPIVRSLLMMAIPSARPDMP